MTVTNPYDNNTNAVADAVDDVAGAGKQLVTDNFVKGMFVTGAFVVWRVGKRVLRSIA